MSAIGVARPRVDSDPKLAGATRYAADLKVPGLLHARLVLATDAHARVRGVDAEAARAVPGVVAVLLGADLPLAAEGALRVHEPLAREEVVFAGQPVALVVAETEAAAEDGAEAVVVDLEPLEAVLDVAAAAAEGAPLVRLESRGEGDAGVSMHSDVAVAEEESTDDEQLSGNVAGTTVNRDGDVDAALAASAAVVSGSFRTPWVHQAYLEPQAATATPQPDGCLVVETSTQAAFYTREQIAKLYGLPLAKVRVVATPLGGAFGAKFLIVEPLAVGAALVLGRPVRVALTRSEDFASAMPAPAARLDVTVGARADGKLAAIRARILMDDGAYSDWSVAPIAAGLVAGPYAWETWDIRALGVLTNKCPTGAYRGPAGPQTAFALETLLDELAQRLGLDPLDLRERNAPAEGSPRVDGSQWRPLAVREVMQAVREHPLWQRRGELPSDEGVGVAAGVWIGATMSSSAVCRMEGDGRLTVITAASDMTGATTSFVAIAAETFGVPFEQVDLVVADTAGGPWSPPSGGSVMTYSMGRAVERAAEEAKLRLLELAAHELEIAPSDLEIVEGEVRAVGAPGTSVAITELAQKVSGFFSGHEPVEGHGNSAMSGPSPSVAAHLAHVRVDRETGEVRLLRYAVAQDCGRALNPALVEGQMRGGATQGIGWALFEELVHDEAGQLVTGSLMNYALPHAEHVPPIDALIVEVPSAEGPFGAKGIGEAGVLPAPPAIANAIAAATGARLRELPMTPPRVWRALADGSAS